jgi:TetR/AcrR family transcriptional repressor of nem operon
MGRRLLIMSIMITFMISVLYKVKAFGAAHVKVSREKVAEHRIRILAAAARLFRQRGFDDVTVAEVMKDAGLTHGAFYGYFPSKEALIAEAVGQALPAAPDQAKPRRAAAEFADGYLSVRHRDNRPTCCLFSSLGTEAARGSADLRHRMTEAVCSRINHLSVEAEGDRPNEKRRAAIAAWSAMVGAMVLARLVDDETLSKEILSATRASLPLV